MIASPTKFRIIFEKESTVSRCCQNSKSWITKWNLKKKKKKTYWRKQKSNHPCLPHGARQQQFACPSKHFLPESSALHGDTTVLACASAITSPSKERDLLAYNEPYVCGEAFWAVKRQKFLSRILQIGATGGRWGPRSIKRTWEKAESWAHIRREAEGRRRG